MKVVLSFMLGGFIASISTYTVLCILQDKVFEIMEYATYTERLNDLILFISFEDDKRKCKLSKLAAYYASTLKEAKLGDPYIIDSPGFPGYAPGEIRDSLGNYENSGIEQYANNCQ